MMPSLCSICTNAGATQVIPDRSDDVFDRFDAFCPLCFDEFLSIYHGIFRRLLRREVSGRLS